MRILQWSTFVFALCAPTWANVISSVDCGVSGIKNGVYFSQSISDDSYCFLRRSDNKYINASAEAIATRVGQFGAWAYITAVGGYTPDYSVATGASAMIDVITDIITPGTVRPGFAQITPNFATDAGPWAYLWANLTFDSYYWEQNKNYTMPDPRPVPPPNGLYPITLGGTIHIKTHVRLFGNGNLHENVYGNPALADVSFSLFEADGVTPVAWQFAPEPSTALLLIFPAALATVLAKQRRRCRRNASV